MAVFAKSPALHATRPVGLIDPHHPAEYPVLLGDALKESGQVSLKSLSMRYNWKAQKPSSIARMQVKSRKSGSGEAYDLTIDDRLHKDTPHRYIGHLADKSNQGKDGDGANASNQSLALVWDPAKSAFILEPISASLDFNLTSAPDQTQREINAHKKLQTHASDDKMANKGIHAGPAQTSDSDSDPDVSNPYDYRHFLAEARENATNSAHHARSRTPIPGSRTPVAGSKTPIPGSRTPLPGLSSPALNAKTSTPQFHATSGPTTTRKRKLDRSPNPAARPPAKPKAAAAARKPASKRPQPLSSERIIDSDDEIDASVVERLPAAGPSSHRQGLASLNDAAGRGTERRAAAASPHLIVSDAVADLEIDLGSPPLRERFTQRRREHVNPDAFRRRNQGSTPSVAVRAQRDADDVEMTDADVEELELGSPRQSEKSRKMSVGQRSAGRVEKDGAEGEGEGEGEDDDDGLAAELEAALEEEEMEDEQTGVGLGIKVGDGEESEVSEEE